MEQEYNLWIKYGNGWEEIFDGSIPLVEALEYFVLESTGDYPVKMTDENGEDVTSYFVELSQEDLI